MDGCALRYDSRKPFTIEMVSLRKPASKHLTPSFESSLNKSAHRSFLLASSFRINLRIVERNFALPMWGAISAALTVIIGVYCITAMVMAVLVGCNGNPLDTLQAAGSVSNDLAPNLTWTGLKVICAGLERTGTESLSEALHLMNLEPAYTFLNLDAVTVAGTCLFFFRPHCKS